MGKALVIVESPAKAKTLEKFLGKDFTVKASGGHVRDLPTHRLGVKVENNFEPDYTVIKDKAKIISALMKSAQDKEIIYLAPDPDREGEAIAWHLAQVLELDLTKVKRIEFNEITQTAVLRAIESPRDINMDRVNAQQARRILDRLVGYKLSPLLWKKVKKGLSAGRVQSVAVWFICEREDAISRFIPVEYWTINVHLLAAISGKSTVVTVELIKFKDKKITISTKQEADEILKNIEDKDYSVTDIECKLKKRNPEPPFITSTLQQEASRKLGWSAKKTMMVAQKLYEGLDINGEHTGLITYMRTDSVRISEEARQATSVYITETYGEKFVGKGIFKQKKNIQDAHEAIRPTYLDKTPEYLQEHIGRDEYRLYTLIWKRFVASLMSPADIAMTTIFIAAGDYLFKITGSITEFPGFMTLYIEGKDDEEDEDGEKKLPPLKKGDKLKLESIDSLQHFTKPPARYTEATLVKTLEEKGIGRPSTYAPIISTIVDRGYVNKVDKNKLSPTELGMIVNKQLKDYFSAIIDVDFTAKMESQFDEIMGGNLLWTEVLGEFYKQFLGELKLAEDNMPKVKSEGKETDIKCDKCGSPMLEKVSRYGTFLACKAFPNCRNTKPIVSVIDVPCPECKGELVEKRTKRGKIFYGCRNYPDCKFAAWNKPLSTKCELCGGMMLQMAKNKIKCHSCSNITEVEKDNEDQD
ncbi:MAG: type I DNA topoisomerase [Candidatus Margulisiibacteriota bacterium]|nr:MAG: type I DNA topoisomerase [Candidatus Margulisiibacteriota bacterium]